MLNSRFMIFLGATVVFLIALGYFFYNLQPTMAGEGGVEFKISRGESFREIGARLSKEELIKSISVFKLYALLTGRAVKFQPGLYSLNYKMSVPEIVGILSAGEANEVKVTIPEGLTVRDIDNILSENGIIKPGQIETYPIGSLSEDFPFLKNISSLEGFLFPDTYRFEVDSEPGVVVRVMLENFEEKVWNSLKDRDDWYSDLILASYLEREVPKYEDRRIVAGILLKRLREGMPLQVDATISYVKCEGAFRNCDKSEIRVVKEDLKKIISPYNTYKRGGWTPTPISNPGEEAVKAAINPRPTPYWYYLSAKGSGETIFSKTLEEQNMNRQKYL